MTGVRIDWFNAKRKNGRSCVDGYQDVANLMGVMKHTHTEYECQ